MIRIHLNRALLVAATTLLATSAYAEPGKEAPKGNPAPAAKAEEKKDKPATPAAPQGKDGKDDKGAAAKDDKGAKDKDADKEKDKGKSASDREARKTKEHEAEKEKLRALLKRPMDEALRQEIRRHAERRARLDRVKAVATEAKDADAVDRATKLIAKEDERHDKWMSKHAATPVDPVPVTAPKGGAQ